MRALYWLALLFWSTAAVAQQRPIFDVDDSVAPSQRGGRTVFIIRLIAGAAANPSDDYRPLDQNSAFISLASAFYWSNFQFDYKRSEVRGEDHNGPADVHVCGQCDGRQYFPTPPSSDSTPAPPLPGAKNSVQLAWYRTDGLRRRITWSHQPMDTVVRSAASGEIVSRLSGDEQSLGVEADTLVRIGGRRLFGVIAFAQTRRTGTASDRTQRELTYMHRLPVAQFGRLLVRPTLTIGGVSDRGGAVINVVNPAIEAFWQDRFTRANLHVIWSPQILNSGREGWTTTHQIAVFIDRHVFVKMFGMTSKLPSSTTSSLPVRKRRTESRTSGDGFSR